MKHGLGIWTLVFCWSGFSATVTSIDFTNDAKGSLIQITADGPITYSQPAGGDKQVVLELKAGLNKTSQRKIDTSSFNDSNVTLISPYNVEGDDASSKIVVQLRQTVVPEIKQTGNIIALRVPASSASASDEEKPPAPTAPTIEDSAPDSSAKSSLPAGSTSAAEDSAPAIPAPKNKMEQFLENQESRKFNGTPITLKVKDADLTDVFRLIGETSGFSIVLGENIKGKVTVSMENVPWDQVLDVVLRTRGLGAERSGSLLRIASLADLTAEKRQELDAKRAAENIAPRITRIFSISYANLDDLAKILSNFAFTQTQQAAAATGAGAAAPGASAIIQADRRTNSIIVRDIAENIERMKKLIELLDLQTPQVLVEGKVIEASEGFSKQISGGLGGAYSGAGSLQGFGSFNGGVPVSPLLGVPPAPAPPNTSGGGFFSLQPNLGFLPGVSVNALLSLAENEHSVKVIASPKTVVLDHENASIIQSTPVLIPTTTVIPGQGTVLSQVIQQANLSLNVTPSVTNEGSVLLQLTLARDVPIPLSGGNTGIGNRNMSTKVLVDSGSTLVIGGVYTLSNTTNSAGFPLLRKIPILGALFGSENETNDRSELFFFITPRIINPREAGLNG